jgi:hypothetical protein
VTGRSYGNRPLTQSYTVSPDTADRQLVEQVCLAVLDVVRPRTERICIDAYSDFGLSVPAQAAQDELRARGSLRNGRRRGDPGMAVELDPSQPADWELARAYASSSIQVELEGTGGILATLHDCGQSISVELTEAEAGRLAGMLPEPLVLEPDDRRRRGANPETALAWPIPERPAGDRVKAALAVLPELALGVILLLLGSADGFAPTVALRRSPRRQLRRIAAGKRLTVSVSWTQERLGPERARVRLSTGKAVLERSFADAEDLALYRPVALFPVGQAPAGGAHQAHLRWLELSTPKGVRYLGAEGRDLALIGRCANWPEPPTR